MELEFYRDFQFNKKLKKYRSQNARMYLMKFIGLSFLLWSVWNSKVTLAAEPEFIADGLACNADESIHVGNLVAL